MDCTECKGVGIVDEHDCSVCEGEGELAPCDFCDGEGFTIYGAYERNCRVCDARGYRVVRELRTPARVWGRVSL
jgi:RecJ-like exonuclease